jgi:hypothetical protein
LGILALAVQVTSGELGRVSVSNENDTPTDEWFMLENKRKHHQVHIKMHSCNWPPQALAAREVMSREVSCEQWWWLEQQQARSGKGLHDQLAACSARGGALPTLHTLAGAADMVTK